MPEVVTAYGVPCRVHQLQFVMVGIGFNATWVSSTGVSESSMGVRRMHRFLAVVSAVASVFEATRESGGSEPASVGG